MMGTMSVPSNFRRALADELPRWIVLLLGLALGLIVTSQAQARTLPSCPPDRPSPTCRA